MVPVESFSIGKFEVTFEELDLFAIDTGRRFPRDQDWGRGQQPVINVSWGDATAYAEWLSEKTGKKYRLPTESEWEYAVRSKEKDYIWAGTSEMEKYAIYRDNSSDRTSPVGSKKPNDRGLYDMSGNVYEWVEDCNHDNYEGSPPINGEAWKGENKDECKYRTVRGGSWYHQAVGVRVYSRSGTAAGFGGPNVGFRLVLDVP